MYNKFNLENKVIIVTGATGLLGIKHVEEIAENGGIPIILDIKEKQILSLTKRIQQKYNAQAMGLKVNITKEKEVINSCKKIIKKFGKIHGLVNNAANNPKIVDKKLNNAPGSSNSLIEFVEDRLGHDYRYSINTAKIEQQLGWFPETKFEEGLSKTVSYFLSKFSI